MENQALIMRSIASCWNRAHLSLFQPVRVLVLALYIVACEHAFLTDRSTTVRSITHLLQSNTCAQTATFLFVYVSAMDLSVLSSSPHLLTAPTYPRQCMCSVFNFFLFFFCLIICLFSLFLFVYFLLLVLVSLFLFLII